MTGELINEFIEENMGMYFSVGVISTILVFFVLIIGVVRLLMFFFIQKKEVTIAYFALENLCLLISLMKYQRLEREVYRNSRYALITLLDGNPCSFQMFNDIAQYYEKVIDFLLGIRNYE